MQAITQFPLFHGLSPVALAEISQQLHLKSYLAQQIIVGEGALSQDIFFIMQGRVQAKKFAADGHEIIFLELSEGEIFGEFSAVDGLTRSTQVIALTNARVGFLSAKVFHALLLKEPQLGLNLAKHLVQKLRLLTERVYDYSAFPVAVRIRKKLLELALAQPPENGVYTLKPAPTQYEIAVMTATHREAVSREFTALAKLGIIETRRQLILINNIAALRLLLSETLP